MTRWSSFIWVLRNTAIPTRQNVQHLFNSQFHETEVILNESGHMYGTKDAMSGVSGLVSGLDYAIGKIVDKLKEKGVYDNTYIIFSSDVSICCNYKL